MRILITNDDGIRAPQVLPLIRYCRQFGEVTAVLPMYEQSGKSHSIEFHKPFEMQKVQLAEDVCAYAVDSSPADCVRLAVLGMHMKFDLVISGINRGLNIGRDIIYSGTAGATFEAAALGIPAVALSTDPDSYPCPEAYLDQVRAFFTTHKLLDKHSLYNVNFPADPKGIRITRQGGPYYSDDFHLTEENLYMAHGKCVYEEDHDYEIDTNAALHGYISISPLTIVRTDPAMFEDLRHLNG